MNPSLNSLKLAIRLAVEDADVTAYDITTTIRETMRELSQAHQVRSNKADAVCSGLSPSGTMPSFGGRDEVVIGGQSPDTISFGAPQAAQLVPPYFGAGGGDVISFS